MAKKQFLLKIDLSGIQTFIFDVPSKGAARELKGRSFYVYALSKICLRYLEIKLGEGEKLYDGGGNCFAYFKSTERDLKQAVSDLQDHFLLDPLFPFIAYIETGNDFIQQMRLLAKAIQKQKYKRKLSFGPFEVEKQTGWKEFSKSLTQNKGYELQKAGDNGFSVNGKGIAQCGISFSVSDDKTQFLENIINKLPLDNSGNIVAFEDIAANAEGVEKIAALKLDVDNLGLLFRNKSKKDYKTLSDELTKFFEGELYKVLRNYLKDGKIYPVFAGGDDCFIIGAWNVVFEAAEEIHNAFNTFQKKLREKVDTIDDKITISGGLIIVGAKYPMIRLAEEAEQALDMAKKLDDAKNKITVFNVPLSWDEFSLAKDIASKLKELIVEKGGSKAILNRIKSSDIGYESLQKKAKDGLISFPKVWRLKYYLRNLNKSENAEFVEENVFNKYARALVKAHIGEPGINPQVFPIAGRWAELLVRKKPTQKIMTNKN